MFLGVPCNTPGHEPSWFSSEVIISTKFLRDSAKGSFAKAPCNVSLDMLQKEAEIPSLNKVLKQGFKKTFATNIQTWHAYNILMADYFKLYGGVLGWPQQDPNLWFLRFKFPS